MNKTHKTILIVVLSTLTGFFIGTNLVNNLWKKQAVKIDYAIKSNNKSNKISALISAIDQMYVDSVNVDTIVDKALPVILKELDPHSGYYPAQLTKESNDELHGSFSGIGIQFSLRDDTIHVNSVIKGGPAEKVGLKAGDRIIYINDTLFAGKKMLSEDVVRRLKGPDGSEVDVGISRFDEPNILYFTIARGPIPIKSVDAAYIIRDNIGYITINKFGETTYSEMMTSLSQLQKEGCKKLIVDLRGNTGGYMGTAILMANEFLPKGQMIVYTKGLHSRQTSEYANGKGRFQTIPLTVLIDETSASASEIFAGAVQDNDRGYIIGRRSFGKGLVQQPIDFSDGSSVRLTIARYYTPSGRCIQKPYDSGDEDYAMDLFKRLQHGEYFSADSVKLNESEVFKTKSGRTVYGGGGIMPDYFVPQDTIAHSVFYIEVVRKSLINKFAYNYVDLNRKTLSAFEEQESLIDFLNNDNVIEQFINFVVENRIKSPTYKDSEAVEQIKRIILANIIYNILDTQEYIKYVNIDDSTVQEAVKILTDYTGINQ
ncbi:MAG TPA: S41 family peptidase [Bacteroidaceae bacterium]|nr:S41 family peptidase [Bacteroidaceae bacterium]